MRATGTLTAAGRALAFAGATNAAEGDLVLGVPTALGTIELPSQRGTV